MSLPARDARNAYLSSTVETASPAQLLLMLLDRLVLDIQRGGRMQAQGEFRDAGRQFVHAQAIVTELMSTLRTEEWPPGRRLMSLYIYLSRRLVQANVRRDTRAARESLWLAQSLTDTWKQAARLAAVEAKSAVAK